MQPRERILAIAVAVIAGGWFVDAVAVSPALAWMRAVGEQTQAAQREADESKALVDRQARILAEWRGRHAAGLADDEAATRFRAQQLIAASARDSGLAVDSVGGGQLVNASRDQAFDLVRVTVSGQGTLSQAQAFVAGLESAAMPLRIERCEFAAQDPKQDRIDLALTISTRIVPAAMRAARQMPAGTPAWKPEARDASLDPVVLAARPFLGDRSRPRAGAAAASGARDERPVAPAGWALVGIVGREPGAAAFLRDLGGSGERQLARGDTIDGATVTAIDAAGLHLSADGAERVITVGSDLTGRAVSLPAAVPARPASSSTPASATTSPAASATPTAPDPVPAAASTAAPAAGPDADREAILQRLRQQRNRNQ